MKLQKRIIEPFLGEIEVVCESIRDLEKPENPFNKRKRILMASKWSRKASFYNWPNPKSMPLLALDEDEEEKYHKEAAAGSDSEDRDRGSDEEDEENERRGRTLGHRFHDRKLVNGFKSKSCFDLQNMNSDNSL
ncbi:hypothetical protein SDJN02_13330, partial [Cucurbita argyrosperma subsp. argyrosperma]